MAKAKTVVGLDVHATKIVAAVLDVETGELSRFAMSGEAAAAAGFCAGLPRPARVAYEAGPTGYGLARELARRGVECVVAAPSKIPRASGDRVKTDRRDAEHLVWLLLAGKLHPVRVPGAEEEALRDLVRAREQVRVDLMRSRHRLSKLLLRHGMRFDDGKAWTDRHRAWLATVTLPWPAAQATLLDVQGAIDALCHRRDGLEREIIALLPTSPWAVQVRRLRCLRGIDTLTAVGLCAEVGDFERFAKAEQLMMYIGLVPCESTTGQQRRLGSITKTGSGHARRLLVEPPGTTAHAPGSAQLSPPARTASRLKRSRSPGRPNGGCTAPGPDSRPAPSAAPSSRSPPPASSPASAGRSPKSSNTRTETSLIPSAGSVAARHARGTRDAAMSNPPPPGPATPDPRQRLPTTNMVLRSQPAHTDENVKGWVQESPVARVTPNEKSRHLGTVEPAAHRLPF